MTTKAVVKYVEGSEEVDITSKTMGDDLLAIMLQRIGLPETMSLIGLLYTDKKDSETFLKLEKKVLKQDMKKEKDTPLLFHLVFQFFPESVKEELYQPTMQRIFWKQVKEAIVKDEIYSPPELCVLFAAQTAQTTYGDYDASSHGAGLLKPDEMLPARVLQQHNLTTEQWEEQIKIAWDKIKMTPKDTAIVDYLEIAQDLEMYGVTYFEVTNKKKTKLWLGVHNLGMDIYEYNNKVTPRLGFPWTEIKNISFNDKKFTIKMVSRDAPDFRFYVPRYKLNKRILALCVGNHKLYVKRRHAQAEGAMQREDRAMVEAKLRRTKAQLLEIRKELESVKDQSRVTKEDKIHEENKAAGMDKFKTMKKAQSGDARKRIQDFENLDDTEC